eukprot:1296534-Pleurochrysis_carterae.AAC.1
MARHFSAAMSEVPRELRGHALPRVYKVLASADWSQLNLRQAIAETRAVFHAVPATAATVRAQFCDTAQPEAAAQQIRAVAAAHDDLFALFGFDRREEG